MSRGWRDGPGWICESKIIAFGRRCESMVAKGVVCKRKVAHRRMTSKLDKPHLLILGGALEYQRISNLLSSLILFYNRFCLLLFLLIFSRVLGSSLCVGNTFAPFVSLIELIGLHPCVGNGPFEDGNS
ncbi:hypothetical protein Dsin_014566 [Dipteronia sinensis]|uniref:Uncharacterized protein n=1 Tax=Dipteronia sinensis TaxID=43782 RepID=A0AAE0EA13_9ROSI|nr:hypothetical protein Dsin_014566 [Dipteronia sinensis]